MRLWCSFGHHLPATRILADSMHMLLDFLALKRTLNESPCACSALAVLASSSGVSSERTAFMDLVKREIDRLNESIGKTGSVTMIFQRGNIRVSLPSPLACQCLHGLVLF